MLVIAPYHCGIVGIYYFQQPQVVPSENISLNIISYPLFADADTGIYPHAASQHQAGPKAKHGIVMLSLDKFLYTWKQTRGNEFIPWSNDICLILELFHDFKNPGFPLIWLKSLFKHSVTRSHRSGKESRWRLWSLLWHHQGHFFPFISQAYDVNI